MTIHPASVAHEFAVAFNSRDGDAVDAVYEHDGIALLIVDWIIGDVKGTATDVARKGADGRWRYVIDNPFGAT